MMTYALVGHKGEEGVAGMFLARLGFGAFLSMNIMGLSWALYDPHWFTLGIDAEAFPFLEKLLFVLALPVMLFVGYPFARNAWVELTQLRLSIDALIALGSFAAFGFSTYQIFSGGRGVYFDTATMTLVLVTAGRYLEANAKLKTTSAIKQLLDLQPNTARVVEGGAEHLVPAETVRAGTTIRVLPGERIPLDATVLESTTSVNEAVLTGESNPVHKRPGDVLYAATVNIDGALTATVRAEQGETVYARVLQLMEQAQQSRSQIQRYVDTLAAHFIPVVIGIALLTLIGWLLVSTADVALLHALSVLVVACPCALGIGTPLATTVALGRAAERGILVRSMDVFEKLALARVVVFDKTGTVTTGTFSVENIQAKPDERTFLSIVASLELHSEHPLGKAIAEHARHLSIPFLAVRNVSAMPGHGVRGEVQIDGTWTEVEVGATNLLPASSPDEHSDGTTVAGVWGGAVWGTITLRDTVRRSAAGAVRQLHALGLRTVLLSGDSEAATERVAREISIPEYYGRRLPGEKLDILRSLKTEVPIVMIGDGINDAPSLATADVGITLGTATDIAKESADVTVLGDHLENIPALIRLSRKTLGTIRWNLFWAFAYNAVGMALAVVGLLQPIVAALAMMGSSVFIIANSRRLVRQIIFP
jgi:heavy metal translocating P-type ATPase